MGVPKFYRWISERYPCLSEVVKDYQLPKFDNLYLDMNGIIHVCSHPEDDNPHFRITEDKIFQDVFHYIEVLFRMIKPGKVFFMAVDGVAPRAKMNQQRGRRFRSAREAEMLVRKAVEKGETLPTEARFDSNCITPGTEFMAKLQEQLKCFIVKKVSTDKLWNGPKIYLSGHETPGEGEHKVMDFIRYQKSQPDNDPNTRHCLYGLDADLMMLGLSSHEPHFSLLREEVKFGGKNQKKRSNAPEETTFHLLHLTLFREYLDYEFAELKDKLPFGYDLERIIDDWVLMGFLVGNDFIPHLPNMHIHHDALPTLWRNYKQVLPTLDGYLHDGGTLNLPRFEKFMAKLSEIDFDAFSDQFSDLKWLEAKTESKAAKDKANIRQRASVSSNDVGIPTANEFLSLRNVSDDGEEDLKTAMGAMTLEEFEDIEDDFMVEENAMLEKEFRTHKDAYYLNKMGLTASREVLRNQAEEYVRALQWILHYYFNGVPSWSWYYPYHYAPYLSDVCNFADMKMNFVMSKPFLPFQQLMAVLPSASKSIMPSPLQTLMVEENSPVLDYYPADFELDMNGKLQEWEAVVLIPFIDEGRLLNAMAPLEEKLTDEEKARNKHGPHTLFYYDPECHSVYQSSMIDKFPDSTVYNHHAKICTVDKDLFRLPPEKIYKGLCSDVSLDVYYPGFPTLKHLPHTARLSKAGVKVFQSQSRGQNTMLTLNNSVDGEQDIEQVAMEYLGRSVYVAWPHMVEAKVVAVADGSVNYTLVENKSRGEQPDRRDIQRHEMDQDESRKWAREVSDITDMYHDRKGIIIGDTDILIYAAPMTGRKYVYNTSIALEKQWSSKPVAYALQATAKNIAVKEPSYRQYKTLEELFTPKTWVSMLGQPHYGCMGEILDVDPSNEGRVRVNFLKPVDPILEGFKRVNELTDKYMPGYMVAKKVGISGFMVSKFTGSLYMSKGSKAHPPARDTRRTNVGLNLKFNKTNMEVPGFTKKRESDNQWIYSQRVVEMLLEYKQKYPELFEYISNSADDTFHEDDIFGEEESTEKVKVLREYLKSVPSAEVAPAEQGTRIVEEDVVAKIEKETERVLSNNKRRKRIKMQVKPHLLYRSLDAQANSLPDPTTTYQLFDRVVNVREGYSVPVGLRGTVIGIRSACKEQDILYEVLFDEEFMDGLMIRCKTNKAYRVPATALINLTHGERKEEAKNSSKPMAVVKPQQGKSENFRPAWPQQKGGGGGGGQWRQDQEQWAGQQQGQGRGSQPGGPNPQIYDRGSQQFGSGNQQQCGSYQQQWRGNSSQDYGHQDSGYGNSHQGYHSNKQQGGAMGGAGQQQMGRQTYHQMQQQPHGQQRDQARWEDKQGYGGGAENNKYAEVWNQPQGSVPQTWSDKSHQRSGNRNKQNRQQQQIFPQPQQHTPSDDHPSQAGGPSLNDAAKALKHSPFSSEQGNVNNNRTILKRSPRGDQSSSSAASAAFHQPSQSQPAPSIQASQPVNIDQLFSKNQSDATTEKEDFNRLMASLHSKGGNSSEQEPQPHKSTAQEGTQALQQLLKVQGNSEAASATGQSSSGAPAYGHQVSVQDLFKGAKESAAEGKVNKNQGATPKSQSLKRNHVGELLDHCKSKGLLAPRYDYKCGRDGKICCVVTMPDGEQFKGSYAKDRQTAMDSAANTALGSVNPSSSANVPGIFLNTKKSAEESSEGNFAMSPNSAFTAVKGTGPMGIEFNFSGAASNRPGDPFPKPPPQPLMQQQLSHQQAQLHSRQQEAGHPDQYYYGQPDPYRHHGTSHNNSHHHHQKQQQYQQKPYHGGEQGYYYQNWSSGGYQQQEYKQQHQQQQHRGQGQQGFDKYDQQQQQQQQQLQQETMREETPQDYNRRDNERSKDNPFVPLQVFKKQKTPVKSENRRSKGYENPRTTDESFTDQYEEERENQNSFGSAAVAPGNYGAASKKQNPRSHNKRDKAQASNSKKDGSPGTEAGKKSQPKRPRSRIAAKFT